MGDVTGALWSSKYEPVDFESLCVHKKKVQDVQRWLEEAYAGGVTSKYRVRGRLTSSQSF